MLLIVVSNHGGFLGVRILSSRGWGGGQAAEPMNLSEFQEQLKTSEEEDLHNSYST